MAPDARKLLNFMQTVQERLQRGLLHLAVATTNVIHRDSAAWPDLTRAAAQERLDHMVGGFTVVYLLSIAEELGVTKQIWRAGLDADDYQFVLATYHVRHSLGHRDDYGRADGHKADFDKAMSSGRVFPGVREHTPTKLRLDNSAGHRAANEFVQLAQRAISKLA